MQPALPPVLGLPVQPMLSGGPALHVPPVLLVGPPQPSSGNTLHTLLVEGNRCRFGPGSQVCRCVVYRFRSSRRSPTFCAGRPRARGNPDELPRSFPLSRSIRAARPPFVA